MSRRSVDAYGPVSRPFGVEGGSTTGSYTPTITQTGQTFNTISATWWRYGQLLYIEGAFSTPAGANSDNTLSVSLPSGISSILWGLGTMSMTTGTGTTWSGSLRVVSGILRTADAVVTAQSSSFIFESLMFAI